MTTQFDKNIYILSASGNLGPYLHILVTDDLETISYKSKRKFRINLKYLYSDTYLQYYGMIGKRYKLFRVIAQDILKSLFFEPRLFLYYFFTRYKFEIYIKSENLQNISILFKESSDIWYSRTSQLRGFSGNEIGFLNDINKFRTKNINRVYLLNFQNKETALSLKNEIEKSINKNSFPSNTIINEIQQGFSRIELIKNAEITSQHFVVAKNSIFPVSNIDVISKVGWPTDLIFSSNQLFSSSKYSKEANYEQGTISKFSSSWYHFLIDCLPLLLKYRNQLEEIPYLFFGEIPSQIREILIAITGINPIMLPNNNTIRVKSLTFLQDYRFHDLYDFSKRREDIDNVRKFLVGEKNDKNGTYATRKILLARETGLFRQLKNSSEVYQLLSDFGFEILYPNKINLEEQIKLYSQTRILVSETGASLVNTIFLPDKSTVIELKFGEIVGHIWPNFIAQSNLNYLQCQMRVNKFTGQGHLDIKQLSSILMKIK